MSHKQRRLKRALKALGLILVDIAITDVDIIMECPSVIYG